MIGALRFRHEILKAEQEQQPIRLNVRFVTPCVHNVHRSESRQLTGHDDDEAEREALRQDPAHQAEIESLLELTNSIEDRVSRRSMLRGAPLNEFFRGDQSFEVSCAPTAAAPAGHSSPANTAVRAPKLPTAPTFALTASNRRRSTSRWRVTTDKSDESFMEGPLLKLQKEGVMKNDNPEVSPRQKKPQAQDSVVSGGWSGNNNGHENG